MLKERDKLYNAIKFVDISSPDYDPVIIKILAMKQYATEQLIYADVVDFKKFLCLPLYTRMQHASFNILASQLYVVYAKCQLAKIYRFRDVTQTKFVM